MDKAHVVEQGECFSSIAKKYGFLVKTLWEHPSNAALREKRKNQNILLPGDKVSIPDMQIKEYDGGTEAKHVFQVIADRVKLELRLLRNDKPRANVKYRLKIGGETVNAQTDDDGWLRTSIEANAKTAELTLLPDEPNEEKYELLIGHLDPLDEDSGILKRLDNLGFMIGAREDGEEDLTNALASFQRKNELAQTGEADPATKDKLKHLHGS